jgi:hypothetical protein
MNHLKNLFLFAFFLPITSFAHIYKIEQFTKDNQTIYFLSDEHYLSDEHESKNPQNHVYHKHQNDIIDIAKKFDAAVLVEDNGYICKQYLENPLHVNPAEYVMLGVDVEDLKNVPENKTPLYCFFSLCAHYGIPSANVEFRFGRLASRHNLGIPIEMALHESDKMADLIATFDDSNPLIKDFYQNKYKYLSNSAKTVHHFLHSF